MLPDNGFGWERQQRGVPLSLNKLCFLFVLLFTNLAWSKNIVFQIPKGTHDLLQDWNDQKNPLRAEVGDTLTIVNSDNHPHQLHTDGRPCDHGDLMQPGQSWSCVLEHEYNALEEEKPTRDHLNYDLRFWIIVTAKPLDTDSYDASKEVYASSGYGVDTSYDDGISYETFQKKIQDSKAQTLEHALELVPSAFFQNYVLMYRSRSLQDASYLMPRAIVFGRSSKFIMAFNGHEKQKGYNNLEIIQYREKTQRWEFREVTFFADKPPLFSEANPAKCLECHQSPQRSNVDPRPNWEPYNFWPGTYASVDEEIRPKLKPDYEGFLSGDKSSLSAPLTKFIEQDFVLVDEQSLELENLNRFQQQIKPSHPRYKFLGRFSLRNPLALTKALVILNMNRVARLAKEELGDLFPVYKYALLGLGDYADMTSSARLKFRCADVYMPQDVLQKHLARTLAQKSLPEKEYLRPQGSTSWKYGFAAGLDTIFLPLGINTNDWSMDFRTDGRFAAQDRFTSPHDSRSHFRVAMENVYPQDEAIHMDCKQLKAASEVALSEFNSTGDLERRLQSPVVVQNQKPLIQRCISCHVNYEDGGQAPAIPFDNLTKLKPLLHQGKYRRGTLFDEILFRTGDHAPLRDQMPPAGLVDRKLRDQFIESLRAL